MRLILQQLCSPIGNWNFPSKTKQNITTERMMHSAPTYNHQFVVDVTRDLWMLHILLGLAFQMMYAGSKLGVAKEAGLTKIFELRSVEELTDEWLKSKLKLLN